MVAGIEVPNVLLVFVSQRELKALAKSVNRVRQARHRVLRPFLTSGARETHRWRGSLLQAARRRGNDRNRLASRTVNRQQPGGSRARIPASWPDRRRRASKAAAAREYECGPGHRTDRSRQNHDTATMDPPDGDIRRDVRPAPAP